MVQYWVRGGGCRLLAHARQVDFPGVVFHISYVEPTPQDAALTRTRASGFTELVILGHANYFGSHNLQRVATPVDRLDTASFPLCGTVGYELSLFQRFQVSTRVQRQVELQTDGESIARASVPYRIISPVTYVGVAVPKPTEGHRPQCHRCSEPHGGRTDLRYASVTVIGNLTGTQPDSYRDQVRPSAVEVGGWCGQVALCCTCVGYPAHAHASGFRFTRSHGNLGAPWVWVKEGSPDGDFGCSDDEDLAGSDYDSAPLSRLDRAVLTDLELHKLDLSVMKNIWDSNKIGKEEAEKIEMYDGTWNDVNQGLPHLLQCGSPRLRQAQFAHGEGVARRDNNLEASQPAHGPGQTWNACAECTRGTE